MQNKFSTALGQRPSSGYTLEMVKQAIHELNEKREDRLLLLLDHIEHQGEYFLLKKRVV